MSSRAEPKSTGRVPVGCQACRVRHTRCDNDAPSCLSCQKANIECIRSLQVRFRNGLDGADRENAFPQSQTWVALERNLEYHDETRKLSQLYEGVAEEIVDPGASPPQPPSERRWISHETRTTSPSPQETLAPSLEQLPSPPTGSPYSGTHEITSPPLLGARPGSQGSSLSYSTHQGFSPSSSHPVVPFTKREAVLMRNFVENMASWADVTDLKRHFELEVPRRALQFPVLRYSVCAFSSRHMNRNKPDMSTESIEYYDKCLNLLIDAVSGQDGQVEEEVLAAISILRQYEEMDADDKELHLTGTSRIVNSMSFFDFSDGLGEAAAWLSLREDIYVSLVRQRPLKMDLENFRQSSVFRRRDDAAYASRMVFLLAKTLGCAFPPAQPGVAHDLEMLDSEINFWFESKPAAFTPIYEEPRNRGEGKLLPDIWVLSAFHAIGLQYYHIAKIILAMSTPIVAASVYDNIRMGKRVENIVRHHLYQVIALAASNTRGENTLFTARHSLSVWGGVFGALDDQQMAVDFLDYVQDRTGWNTALLRESLREQWAQDRGMND
ncbi:hypothetical protein BGZ63DRAFT_460005 [Mariannaea sp. PMI_226]|nr:hypothetical protein BGZ63DRAFT_460005 [Mariannaea sp. PMI_226]